MTRLLKFTAMLAGLLVLLACPAAKADSWTFALVPPSGAIFGPPGSTIGWGYSIANQSTTNWLMLTGLSADPFLHGTPDGSFFTFPILAPNSSISASFDPVAFTGLYGLTWDQTAPVGFTNSGTFILSGQFWDNDPFQGGNFVSFGQDQTAAYSATVTQGGPAPVPEPGSLLLFSSGLFAIVRLKSQKLPRA